MRKSIKRDPTHVRAVRVQSLIQEAATASAHGELEKACSLYHKALEDLEGMVHYNDVKHRVFFALAVLSLHMQAPSLADEYARKAVRLLDKTEEQDACLSEFSQLLHDICPPSTMDEKVIPFRLRDYRYHIGGYREFPPNHKAAVAPLRNHAAVRGGLEEATGEQSASQNRASEGEMPAG